MCRPRPTLPLREVPNDPRSRALGGDCSEGDGDLPLFFGTTTNAFGRMHFRFVDKVFDDYGLQGVMHDEFNVATVSYTFSAWE